MGELSLTLPRRYGSGLERIGIQIYKDSLERSSRARFIGRIYLFNSSRPRRILDLGGTQIPKSQSTMRPSIPSKTGSISWFINLKVKIYRAVDGIYWDYVSWWSSLIWLIFFPKHDPSTFGHTSDWHYLMFPIRDRLNLYAITVLDIASSPAHA